MRVRYQARCMIQQHYLVRYFLVKLLCNIQIRVSRVCPGGDGRVTTVLARLAREPSRGVQVNAGTHFTSSVSVLASEPIGHWTGIIGCEPVQRGIQPSESMAALWHVSM